MANTNQARKVLFFIAGVTPTAAEQALIDRIVGQVGVRSVLHNTSYGLTGGNAEACDVVAKGAGVTIPAAFNGKTDVTPIGTGAAAAVDTVVSNGTVVATVNVTGAVGASKTCTFTVAGGVITAIALS